MFLKLAMSDKMPLDTVALMPFGRRHSTTQRRAASVN